MIIDKGVIVASDSPENLSGRLSGASGSARQKLIIKGAAESVRTALKEIPTIGSLNAVKGPEDGLAEAVISAVDDRDIREDVFRALAAADLPILQMGPMDLSLEEIFLNLTTAEEEA